MVSAEFYNTSEKETEMDFRLRERARSCGVTNLLESLVYCKFLQTVTKKTPEPKR